MTTRLTQEKDSCCSLLVFYTIVFKGGSDHPSRAEAIEYFAVSIVDIPVPAHSHAHACMEHWTAMVNHMDFGA